MNNDFGSTPMTIATIRVSIVLKFYVDVKLSGHFTGKATRSKVLLELIGDTYYNMDVELLGNGQQLGCGEIVVVIIILITLCRSRGKFFRFLERWRQPSQDNLRQLP
jgi:hypothetical protein